MKTGICWTTKEKKEIDIGEMEDSHLANTIKFLERKIKAYPGYSVYSGNSELAEEAVEQENEQNEEHFDACCAMKDLMIKEQKRRGTQKEGV